MPCAYWSPSSCLVEPMAPMRWNGQLLVSTLKFREQVMARKGMAAARRAEMDPSGRAESDSLGGLSIETVKKRGERRGKAKGSSKPSCVSLVTMN